MPTNNESPSLYNRVPIAVTSRDFTSATRCLNTNEVRQSAQEDMRRMSRVRREGLVEPRVSTVTGAVGWGTYKKPEDPEDVARALGVVEDQTLAALRKLKQLGWVWDGKDWVYDYKGDTAT